MSKCEPPDIYLMMTKKIYTKRKPGKVSNAAEGIIIIIVTYVLTGSLRMVVICETL